jgi:hypothetical protein
MSTLKVTTIQTSAGGAVTLTKQEAANTTLNLNQVTQATVRSLNISSTADGGSADSTINYTNNYDSDATYVFQILAVYDGAQSYGQGVMGHDFSKTDSAMRFRHMHVTSNVYDCKYTNVVIHGDLA